MKVRLLVTFLLLTCVQFGFSQDSVNQEIDIPEVKVIPIGEIEPYQLGYEEGKMTFTKDGVEGETEITINGAAYPLSFANGKASVDMDIDGGKLFLISTGKKYDNYKLTHVSPQTTGTRIKNIPLWLSILPPLIAIILALIFKEVIVSLFIGIWSGAFIVNGMKWNPLDLIRSLFEVVEKYIVNTLSDGGHLSIIVFSLLIGGMVAIISRNGGMAGVVEKLSVFAKDAKSTQFITWLLGVAIFFDDYANTLIVGNTMRAPSDKFKISREKLAYIVDSTAAPVAAIAFITTWIGVELSYIKTNMVGLEGLETVPSAYSVFLSSLQYSFYPLFTLAFILMIIFMKRDFGPMLSAERRARTTGLVANKRSDDENDHDVEDLSPVKNAPLRWYNALIPVLTVILVTIIGLIETGTSASFGALAENAPDSDSWGAVWSQLHLLSENENVSFFERLGILVGNADSYIALIWASLAGVIVGLLLTVSQRIMNLFDSMNTMVSGFKTMFSALIILALAWSLGDITSELNTATFLTSALQDSVNPYWMPAIIFILSGAIAFSTGSSWSTMAILYPIAIPATWAICVANGMDADVSLAILYNVIATVLAAAVFGDHCSPISDTTILSSLATDCNHIDHVRTQMPYALTVGVVSIIMGFVSTAVGLPFIVNLVIGLAILFAIIRFMGKPTEG